MYRWIVFSVLLVDTLLAGAQPTDSLKAALPFRVTVQAYAQNKRLLDVAGPVAVIAKSDLNRYGNNSIVQAINALPGIRMEERSPGSYRLNFRGSSLRAPFGVRNVKVYYNGFPLTDPGGNTYLNQLGFYNFASMEIIKGPGSSLYGAGTGGAMLIESLPTDRQAGIVADYTGGSFGLSNSRVQLNLGNDAHFSSLQYQRLSSDGYRDHSAMKREVLSWDAATSVGKGQLSAHWLYSDLFYQTPGALTQAEFDRNPRAARPPAGTAPGAQQAQAAIYLKNMIAGASYHLPISNQWQYQASAYGAYTQLNNPAIRNYGRNSEPHLGARTVVQYTSQPQHGKGSFTWHLGGEWQQAFNTVQVYTNKAGNPDSLVSNDDIQNRQYFVFTQGAYACNRWMFTIGASLNKSHVQFARTTNRPAITFNRRFNNQVAPRLAILYSVGQNASLYASVAKGFSPPAVGELTPSGSAINAGLEAETGYNTEVGSRGSTLNGKLSWDVNAFYYRLSNAIVQRRDALGGDFFVNAGGTRQWGLEAYTAYRLGSWMPALGAASRVWASYAWYRFTYHDFKQLTNDFSGKQLPGVAPHTLVLGADLLARQGWFAHATCQYSASLALNDANTAYSRPFTLLGLKGGYTFNKGKSHLQVFAGADNLLNQAYSLGNDINGFGGRYLNAAAGRNYFAGISVQQPFRKKPQ